MTKLQLTEHAYRKLKYYVSQCEDEISGFGKVLLKYNDLGDPYFVVTDVEIFKQTVGPAHATMDEDSLAKFIYDKTKAGESLVDWRFWWHSHAKMKAFFSGTDTGTIDESKEYPWLVSLVTNHDGDFEARIDVHTPVRYHTELKVEIIEQDDEDLKAQCLKEIEEKVSKTVYSYNKHDKKGKYGTYQDLDDDGDDDYTGRPWADPTMEWDYKKKEYVKKKYLLNDKGKSSTHDHMIK